MKTVANLLLALSLFSSVSALADHPVVRRRVIVRPAPRPPVVRPIPHRPYPGPIVSRPVARERVLGSTTLSYNLDRDVINVIDSCPSRFAPPVRSLRIRVTGAPARIDQIRVRFQNGLSRNLPVGGYVQPGQTRIVDVPGIAQCVDAVSILGETLESYYRVGQEARVTISGIR